MGTFNFIDLTGEKFNMLTVIQLNCGDFMDCTRWDCVCDCGNKCIIKGRDLKRGKTKSCGCLRGKFQDITGNTYNKLTVISLNSKKHPAKWNCICECGNHCVVIGSSLKNGGTKSCGCLYKTMKRRPPADLTGLKFNRLTVLFKDISSKSCVWFCRCDCGKITNVHVSNLTTGHTKSCGCFNIEMLKISKRTHGCSVENKRLYRIWNCMKYRCNSKKHSSYEFYGGRGIVVCKEWEDCTVFFEWALSNGYKPDLTLHRVDNNGNYCPENCIWVTVEIQMQNTSRSLGEEKVLEIRRLLSIGFKQNKIAKIFNVDSSVICIISQRKSYKNI